MMYDFLMATTISGTESVESELPQVTVGRQERFPINVIRYSENLVAGFRTRLLERAASNASDRQPEGNTYVVEREDVDAAFNNPPVNHRLCR